MSIHRVHVQNLDAWIDQVRTLRHSGDLIDAQYTLMAIGEFTRFRSRESARRAVTKRRELLCRLARHFGHRRHPLDAQSCRTRTFFRLSGGERHLMAARPLPAMDQA